MGGERLVGLSPLDRKGVGGMIICCLSSTHSKVVKDAVTSATELFACSCSELLAFFVPTCGDTCATNDPGCSITLWSISSSLYTVPPHSSASHGHTNPSSSHGQVCVSTYSSSATTMNIIAPTPRNPTCFLR